MRKKVTVIVLFSILIVVIYLSFKLRNDEANEIINEHFETVGVISIVGWKTIDVSYSVNGITYSYTQNKPYSDLEIGEEFYTLVSKKKLSRALVFYDHPIIDTIKYKFDIINPSEVKTLIIDNSELSFSYKVGDSEFDRIQKYEDGKRPKHLKKLKVMYRIDRPEIGYLVDPKK